MTGGLNGKGEMCGGIWVVQGLEGRTGLFGGPELKKSFGRTGHR